jgi:hypothetical protein
VVVTAESRITVPARQVSSCAADMPTTHSKQARAARLTIMRRIPAASMTKSRAANHAERRVKATSASNLNHATAPAPRKTGEIKKYRP